MSRFLNDSIATKAQLPTSFQYPTMQLRFNKLPSPNQMGPPMIPEPQLLFIERTDHAHLRFSKPKSTAAMEVSPAEANKLMSKLLQNTE